MDVIFNCPKCEQELAVDSSGVGSEIGCPACGESITIPEPETVVPRPGQDAEPGAPRIEPHTVNPIATSAAAKVEMHLRVASNKAPESLITKPLAPLDAKDSEKGMRIRTIRHTDCIEVGHDKFDEVRDQIPEQGGRGQHHQHQYAGLHLPGHRHARSS